MRLNASTDYAIRLILYLAKESKIVSSSKLSSSIGVSPRYLLQIGSKLRKAGVVDAVHGATGGYKLIMSPSDITLYDIVAIMEKGSVGTGVNPACETQPFRFPLLKTAYQYTNDVLARILKSITVESLLTQRFDEWYLAPCLLNQSQEK